MVRLSLAAIACACCVFACGRLRLDDQQPDGALGDRAALWLIGGWTGTSQADTVFHSDDGVTWNNLGGELPAALSSGVTATLHGALYYVGGKAPAGNQSSVLRSTDGMTWAHVGDLPLPRDSAIGFAYHDALWIAGGELTDADPATIDTNVWRSSDDGASWTNADGAAATTAGALPFGRAQALSIVFDDKMWVIGGKDAAGVIRSNVWRSIDGTTWLNADGSAPTSEGPLPEPHWGSGGAAVFGGKMWVVGNAANGAEAKVYVSGDGFTWQTIGADEPARAFASIVAFGDALLLIGGDDGNVAATDTVFRTSDGVAWTASGILPAGRELIPDVISFAPIAGH